MWRRIYTILSECACACEVARLRHAVSVCVCVYARKRQLQLRLECVLHIVQYTCTACECDCERSVALEWACVFACVCERSVPRRRATAPDGGGHDRSGRHRSVVIVGGAVGRCLQRRRRFLAVADSLAVMLLRPRRRHRWRGTRTRPDVVEGEEERALLRFSSGGKKKLRVTKRRRRLFFMVFFFRDVCCRRHERCFMFPVVTARRARVAASRKTLRFDLRETARPRDDVLPGARTPTVPSRASWPVESATVSRFDKSRVAFTYSLSLRTGSGGFRLSD